MSALIDRIRKNSKIDETAILAESMFFNSTDFIPTSVPAMNVALSGSFDGGLVPGLTVFAGPSKHFKTAFSMLLAKSYLDAYDDAVILMYDSEFGAPAAYFDSFGIDQDRVVHSPVTDIEQLKFDCATQIDSLTRDDNVFIMIDSVGNLASKKEVEDALDSKSVADMTRAKAMKSLFRIITPHLTIKNIPAVVVNHTYKEIGMFPKDIVSGGTGIYYSADNIFIVGRQQEKKGTDILGYNFILNVEKSRFVKEKSKIPVQVTWEDGIHQWSGLFEMGLKSGHIVSPKQGWYKRPDDEKMMQKSKMDDAFFNELYNDQSFRDWVKAAYTVDSGSPIIDFGDELEADQ